MNPILGVILHAIGGLAAASFYIPYKKVRHWAWETYWLSQGFFSWLVMPIVMAWITTPNLGRVLAHSPVKNMLFSYFFGVLWGVGGLTFGLSMRYLGISLGMSLALGFCAAFGTLIPPVYATMVYGDPLTLFTTIPGWTVFAGVTICFAGISVCCYAGVLKERELSDEQKKAAIKEFALFKGFAVAVFSGIMSACFAYALAAGKPIAEIAFENGAKEIFKNNPVFIFAMGAGFTTNCLWCLLLNFKNKSFRNYFKTDRSIIYLISNYFLALLGGLTWYLQFFFYGMGTTQLGKKYDFASWSIHMAFIIIFSNMWGLFFREWKGSGRRTFHVLFIGIGILILSTIIIGWGNYLAALRP